MEERNKARKSGNKEKYKQLRNKVTKLVKRDQIKTVLKRIGRKPSSKNAWNEAKLYLGKGKCNNLPQCTSNSDPKFTAETQNVYFINKIDNLMESISNNESASLKYSCEFCDKKFSENHVLNCHIAEIHRGEKSLECHECKENLLNQQEFGNHMISMHEGKKPYHCDLCNKFLLKIEDLKSHSLCNHKEKNQFTCNYCREEFCDKNDLNCHVISVHEGRKSKRLPAKKSLHPWASDIGKAPPCSKSSQSGNFTFKFVSASDITKVISRLKNTKALGVDNISTEVLKKGIITLAGPLARLCNTSMASGIVPDLFKKAIIHPFYKGQSKDPRDPGSYRPVAILPAMSKILEIVVRDSLLSWFNEINFLPESQYGFRLGRSVSMALTVAQNDWIHAQSKNDVVGLMAFDLSSAFDTLKHSTLLSKLKSARISGTQLNWFESYLKNRYQSVLWNSVLSSSLQIKYGVPQGSILGPILFLVMIHDMPSHLSEDSLTSSSRSIGYADDTTAYTKAKSLQEVSNEFEKTANSMIQYCNENSLVINSQKTQILTSAKQEIEIKIGENMVPSSKTINLLGLEYDENFSTAPYLHKLAREARTRAALIYRLSFGMPKFLLKTFASGLLMGKILAAATAALPIKLCSHEKPFLQGALSEIDKSIRATARTISGIKLKDKVRSETVLWKAGMKSLTETVSETMACSIWKARKEMNPLGCMFQKNRSKRYSDKLCKPIPGHPQAASNKLAQVWNEMNLSNAKTLGNVKSLAKEWHRKNETLMK